VVILAPSMLILNADASSISKLTESNTKTCILIVLITLIFQLVQWSILVLWCDIVETPTRNMARL
jgi:hypothetical protein